MFARAIFPDRLFPGRLFAHAGLTVIAGPRDESILADIQARLEATGAFVLVDRWRPDSPPPTIDQLPAVIIRHLDDWSSEPLDPDMDVYRGSIQLEVNAPVDPYLAIEGDPAYRRLERVAIVALNYKSLGSPDGSGSGAFTLPTETRVRRSKRPPPKAQGIDRWLTYLILEYEFLANPEDVETAEV